MHCIGPSQATEQSLQTLLQLPKPVDSTNCSGKIASPSDTLVMEECISNDLKSIPTKTDETEKNECGNRSNTSETLAHEYPIDENVKELTALSKENNLITNSGDNESSMKS